MRAANLRSLIIYEVCKKTKITKKMVRNYDNASDIKRFSHSIGQNWYHIVLIPKGRFPIFQWEILRDIADKAIIDVCNKHSIDLFEKEVMEDHIHLFVSCPPNFQLGDYFKF